MIYTEKFTYQEVDIGLTMGLLVTFDQDHINNVSVEQIWLKWTHDALEIPLTIKTDYGILKINSIGTEDLACRISTNGPIKNLRFKNQSTLLDIINISILSDFAVSAWEFPESLITTGEIKNNSELKKLIFNTDGSFNLKISNCKDLSQVIFEKYPRYQNENFIIDCPKVEIIYNKDSGIALMNLDEPGHETEVVNKLLWDNKDVLVKYAEYDTKGHHIGDTLNSKQNIINESNKLNFNYLEQSENIITKTNLKENLPKYTGEINDLDKM